MIPGNTNWNAAADQSEQGPVYFLEVDGITTERYSTAPVKSPSVTYHLILGTPEQASSKVDLVDGQATVGVFKLPLYDVAGKATSLIAVGAPGSLLPTWRNRLVTIWAGYRGLVEADYVAVAAGLVSGISRMDGNAGYILAVSDIAASLEAPIMLNATDAAPSTIRGNVVNVVVSILRGVFSTTDPDFPLTFVSTASGSSSVPTGLGIADDRLDLAGMAAERERWHAADLVDVEFGEPEDGRKFLEREFFRAFQARVRISGSGVLGFAFLAPPLPIGAGPQVLDTGTAIELVAWDQLLADHLNRFRYRGDYDRGAGTFQDLYAEDTAEDTADQAETDETVEYLVESRLLTTADDGVEIATELAGRMRQLYLPPTVRCRLALTFRQRRLEVADVVLVTHPQIPDLRTGTMGITGRTMLVLALEVDFRRGRLLADLLDIGLRRYGVISPSSVGSGTYPTATAAERSTFFFVCNGSEQMADGSDGYRLI